MTIHFSGENWILVHKEVKSLVDPHVARNARYPFDLTPLQPTNVNPNQPWNHPSPNVHQPVQPSHQLGTFYYVINYIIPKKSYICNCDCNVIPDIPDVYLIVFVLSTIILLRSGTSCIVNQIDIYVVQLASIVRKNLLTMRLMIIVSSHQLKNLLTYATTTKEIERMFVWCVLYMLFAEREWCSRR